MLDRIHHLFYAAAVVASVTLVCVFFAPQHPRVAGVVAPTSDAADEIHALRQHIDALEAVRANVVSPLIRPAVAAVRVPFFSDAEVAQILAGLGRERTIPVYGVSKQAPQAKPTTAPPSGITDAEAAYLSTLAYNADAQALKDTTLHFDVRQEPAPPSRIKSIFAADRSAGIAVAVRRRGAFDLDVGYTQGAHGAQPLAGVEWRISGTSAGIFAGVTLRRGALGAQVAIPVSLP